MKLGEVNLGSDYFIYQDTVSTGHHLTHHKETHTINDDTLTQHKTGGEQEFSGEYFVFRVSPLPGIYGLGKMIISWKTLQYPPTDIKLS